MKEIAGWPGYYVSPDGCVWNDVAKRWVIPSRRPDGYEYVRLNRNSKERKVFGVKGLLETYWRKKKEYPGLRSEPSDKWRCIPGFPGYIISVDGDLYSLKSKRYIGHDNNSSPNAKRYALLSSPEGYKSKTIANLMALVFGPDIPSLEGERWLPAKMGGNIWVSDQGRLWSMSKQDFIKPNLEAGKKYLEYRKVKVHRIVAETFCPHPKGCDTVDHINENRYDNRACNLEWVTQEENQRRYASNHYQKGGRPFNPERELLRDQPRPLACEKGQI